MEQKQMGFWDASPKAMFFMGLFLGIAVAATIGLGLSLRGVWTTSATAQAPVAANNPPYVDPNNPPPTTAGPVKPVDAADHIRGNKDAKVTLIEYSDFQCPYCKRFSPTLDQALKAFPQDVRLVYRHFPLSSIHPYAQKAGEASECANKLGGNDAFWKMHDKMIASEDLTNDNLKKMAKDIGLDQGKFTTCLDSNEMANRVGQDFNEGGSAGVEGTPATFVNGTLVSGAVPYEGAGGFKEALQKAGAAK